MAREVAVNREVGEDASCRRVEIRLLRCRDEVCSQKNHTVLLFLSLFDSVVLYEGHPIRPLGCECVASFFSCYHPHPFSLSLAHYENA